MPRTLIVTRPAAQAAPMVAALHALGVPARALPLIEIAPADDPAPLRDAWATLPGSALAMFVSANAVEHFFAAAPPGTGWPPGCLAGATGPGTAGALRAAGVPVAAIAEPPADAPRFDSEALWRRLDELHPGPWRGQRAWIVRGEDGRDWLAETLAAAGAEVRFVAAYRRRLPTLDAAAAEALARAAREPAAQLWHFSSSEALRHLQRLLAARGLPPPRPGDGAAALATHPRIARAARAAGFGRVDEVGVSAEQAAQAWRSLESGSP
jgi:uroporphyrinogen-III synthase